MSFLMTAEDRILTIKYISLWIMDSLIQIWPLDLNELISDEYSADYSIPNSSHACVRAEAAFIGWLLFSAYTWFWLDFCLLMKLTVEYFIVYSYSPIQKP